MPFRLSSIIMASGIPGNSFCTCCGYAIRGGHNTYCMVKTPSQRSGGMWCERCFREWETTGKRPPAQFLACGHGLGLPIEQKAAYVSFECVECGAITTHTRARLRTKWMQRHQSIPIRPVPKPGCAFEDPDEARELRQIDLSGEGQ
jgi:hypothetical protein